MLLTTIIIITTRIRAIIVEGHPKSTASGQPDAAGTGFGDIEARHCLLLGSLSSLPFGYGLRLRSDGLVVLFVRGLCD